MVRNILISNLCFILMGSVSGAGTLIEMKGSGWWGHKIYLQDGKARIETRDRGPAVLYELRAQDNKNLIEVNTKTKSYVEYSEVDVAKWRSENEQLKVIRAETLRSIQKGMPPAYAKKLKDMHEQNWRRQDHKPEITFKKVQSGEKIKDWVCDKYEIYSDGVLDRTVWITDFKALSISSQDYDLLFDRQYFYKGGRTHYDPPIKLPGFPVKTIIQKKNGHGELYEVFLIRNAKIPDEIFEVPAGFIKKPVVHASIK